MEAEVAESLLSKSWKTACGLCLLTYILAQIIWALDHIYSTTPICDAELFTNWIYEVKAFESALFFGHAAVFIVYGLFIRLSDEDSNNFIAESAVTITIDLVAGTASLTFAAFGLGGVCEDAFGVKSSGTQAAEWTSTVPLLTYTLIAFGDKNDMTKTDKLALSAAMLAMICMSLLQIKPPFAASVVLLAFCTMSASLCVFLVCKDILCTSADNAADLHETDTGEPVGENSLVDYKANRKQLCKIYLCTMALFPFFYFLRVGRAIDNESSVLAFSICNVVAKMLFLSVSMATHIGVINTVTRQQKRNAQLMRNLFLRYIMHEIRVPLNSISMGVEVLQLESKANDDSSEREALLGGSVSVQDSLGLIVGATDSISQTLDDILETQRIEEGQFELSFVLFSLSDMIRQAFQNAESRKWGKNVSFCVDILQEVPDRVVGDVTRIGHVLRVLLEKSIDRAPNNSAVTVSVTTRQPQQPRFTPSALRSPFFGSTPHSPVSPTGDAETDSQESAGTETRVFVVSVSDSGPVVSEARRKMIFMPYSHLRVANEGGSVSLKKSKIEPRGSDSSSRSENSMQEYMTRVARGTGIESVSHMDLFVCKQLIEKHGGSIRYNPTTEGRGNTFEVSIPLKVVKNLASIILSTGRHPSFAVKPTSRRTGDAKSARSHSNRSKRIRSDPSDAANLVKPFVPPEDNVPPEGNADVLGAVQMSVTVTLTAANGLQRALVVDDVLACRKFLGRLLQKQGVTCEEAKDGAEAVEVVLKDLAAFQVIFMDNSMPIMTGLEATKVIRRAGFSNLVVAVTGNSMQDEVDAFLRAGADLVCTKPFKLTHLQEFLRYVSRRGFSSDKNKKMRLRNEVIEEFALE